MRRVQLAVVGLVAAALASSAIVAATATQDKARVTKCADNLSQLWKMQYNYMVQFGGPQKRMPLETGDAFWLKLSQTKPALIDPEFKAIYQCPVENFADEGCDYRGPNGDVNKFAEEVPVGADVPGNHGRNRGGNVLCKTGEVREVEESDKLWTLAGTHTTGGSTAQYTEAPEETPKQKQACVHLGQLAIAVMMYREFTGALPKALSDLVEKPKDAKYWPEDGFLLGGKVPKDPWGNDYQYERGDREPKIWSWGADGKKGGTGENADLTMDDVFRDRPGSGRGDVRVQKCKALIELLTQACEMYRVDMARYPASGNASLVKALATAGARKTAYCEFRKEALNDKGELLDPWGNPFVYRNNLVNWPGNKSDPDAHNKQSVDIYSFGSNGKDEKGAGDDINNWD